MEILYPVLIFLAIAFEGFFSGAEIAIVSLNRIRLRILAEAKVQKAVSIQKMLKNPNRLLATTLVGTNFAVVAASSLLANFLYRTYGIKEEIVTTIILAPLVLIFGEFIPKALFAQGDETVTFRLSGILQFFWKLFYPVVWLVTRVVNLILGIIFLGKFSAAGKKSFLVTREEIKYLIKESEAQGEIQPHESLIIYKVFDFGRKKSKDIMKPLSDMAYLSDKALISDLVIKARHLGLSRFPIRAATGEFLGIVNILDAVYEVDKTQSILKFLRPLVYVNTNMDIDNALFLLQSQKQSLTIVRDHEGAAVGFFTMEDLLKQLVG